MVLSRRQFLGVAGGVVGGVTTAGVIRAAAWPLLASEDLLPGAAPTERLTPQAWTTTPDRVRLAVVGDTGSGGRQAMSVAARMARTYEQRPYGTVVLLGDISYYGSIEQRWDDVFVRPFAPLMDAGVRFDFAIGNHDATPYREDAAAEEIEAHLRLLGTPDEFYAVSHGPVDLFVLDSSMPGVLGPRAGDQLAWLDDALASSTNQWRVVALHHPLYSSGKHGSTMAVRDALEPILTRRRVDLVLSGATSSAAAAARPAQWGAARSPPTRNARCSSSSSTSTATASRDGACGRTAPARIASSFERRDDLAVAHRAHHTGGWHRVGGDGAVGAGRRRRGPGRHR